MLKLIIMAVALVLFVLKGIIAKDYFIALYWILVALYWFLNWKSGHTKK